METQRVHLLAKLWFVIARRGVPTCSTGPCCNVSSQSFVPYLGHLGDNAKLRLKYFDEIDGALRWR